MIFKMRVESVNYNGVFSALYSGGWSFGTQKFKDMSSTRYARQTFIYSAIPYLRDRNFDGLDIDWEYPKGGEDKKNYVLLLKGKDSLGKGQQVCRDWKCRIHA